MSKNNPFKSIIKNQSYYRSLSLDELYIEMVDYDKKWKPKIIMDEICYRFLKNKMDGHELKFMDIVFSKQNPNLKARLIKVIDKRKHLNKY